VLICAVCGRENEASFRFCPTCGAELAREASDQRRQLATLLFCDVYGSTSMGERLDSESVREIMHRYFHEMRSVIERHGGTVEKFVGDAVMAVFGVPKAHEDDPVRAVRAAWEMEQAVPSLNDELERCFGSRIALRIGVNTGEVVTGDASSRETIVSGDAVNVAARLEQAAQPGEILLGDQTYQLARDAVSVEPLQPLTLKGKSEAVPAYRLVAIEGHAPGRKRGFQSEMVAREEELEKLGAALERAVELQTGILEVVVGMPGVGKSRLAGEFLGEIDGPAATGRCLSYGEGVIYWPLTEAVRQAAGIIEEDPASSARAKLARLVRGEERGSLIADRIAQALGLAGGVAPAEEIRWAFRRFFVALARRRPLALLIDDLQWAQPELLDLLEGLAATDEAPLLVLGLGRPELLDARPSWSGSALRLEPLDEAARSKLVENLVGGAHLRAELRAQVLTAGGGNPLFTEELLALMLDDPAAEIPPTLDLLLTERLERLSQDERRAAERGSVEGQVFHRGAVLELSETRTLPKTAAALERLAGRDILRPTQPTFRNEAAFAFRHILIRDAAYRAMLKKLRALLHERFARWLERVASDRIVEYEEVLGYHLERAFRYREELGPVDQYRGLADRAAHWLGRSGTRAARLGDAGAAVRLLERAVGLLMDDAPSRPELLLTLGGGPLESLSAWAGL
jgi:class 3 adenylate cyclase